jgi:hypothetical protein
MDYWLDHHRNLQWLRGLSVLRISVPGPRHCAVSGALCFTRCLLGADVSDPEEQAMTEAARFLMSGFGPRADIH